MQSNFLAAIAGWDAALLCRAVFEVAGDPAAADVEQLLLDAAQMSTPPTN